MPAPLARLRAFFSPSRSWVLLLAVGACLFFIGLGRLPLLEPDEGRNAEVAREMLLARDWITPHFNGLPYLDKPVLLFWAIAGSFRVFGLSAWAARVPEACAALATLFLTWLMAARMFGERTGLLAGIILATSPLFFGFARFVIFDMPLTLLVTLAVFCFWLNSERGFASHALDAVAFAAMGLATLDKGPVGFLLPLITLVVYAAAAGRLRELKKPHWLTGWLLLFAIVLPWFIAVSLRHPHFPKYALWEESLLRFTTGAHLNRSESAFYYIPVFLAGFFPWSLFLLFAAWNRRKRWRELRQSSNDAVLFLLAWAMTIFVFFSISHSKLPGYVVPAFVPLSLLLAAVWREADPTPGSSPPDWLTAGLAAMILSGLLMVFSSGFLQTHSVHARLAAKLPSSVLFQLKPALLFGGLIVAALGFLGRNLAMARRRRALRALVLFVPACALPLLVLRWYAPIRNYYSVFSSRTLADTILSSRERALPLYGYFYFRTGLPFYLRRPVGLVTADAGEMTSNYVVSQFSVLRRVTRGSLAIADPSATDGWRDEPLLIRARRLQALGRAAPGPFMVLVRNNEANQALAVAGPMVPLWQGWRFSVWEKK